MPNKPRHKRGPPRKGRAKKKRPRRRRRKTVSIRKDPFTAMVADPCGATLVPGLYGTSEGFLAKTRSNITDTSLSSCGYLIWIPSYSNYGPLPGDASVVAGLRGNLFSWNNTLSSTNPTNGSPGVANWTSYGRDAHGGFTSASTHPDPASVLLSGDMVEDARCLSACMKMTYTGRMDASAGQVCFVENLPISDLLGSEEAHGDQGRRPMSVDDIFNLSNSVTRLGVDTVEAVHRAQPVHSKIFQNPNDSPYVLGHDDATFWTPSYVDINADAFGHHAFGIAWRSLDATTPANLSFELTKNIEWRPSSGSGFAHVPPVTLSSTDRMSEIQKRLDRDNPSWNKRIISSAGSMASSIMKTAFTGVYNEALGSLGALLLV